MEAQRIHVFMPSMDGEYIPVNFKPKRDLKESEVLIFLDEDNRQIFIWTGSKSNVRKRFISSQIARQMRLEKGMTHRISTEEQGNETQKFWTLINSLGDEEIKASTLLEVTPPVSDFQTISSEPVKPKPAPKKQTVTKTSNSTKSTAPPPRPAKTEAKIKAIKSITQKKVVEKAVEEPLEEILYFSEEVKEEVPVTKARLLAKSTGKELIFSNLILSSASTTGKVAFFSLEKSTKTASCKTAKAILVIYL
ncbi:MAG: hypothetical protein ACTSW1_11020, partial [Candidatus Hodarchaeales archaeon]